MAEKSKLYNLESFTDEERERVEALINQIEEERKGKKWWIIPKYDFFSDEESQFDESYIVEEQEDFYSKSRPPLKSDFDSKEEAEKWLAEYIAENSMFNSARDDLNDLILGLDLLCNKLRKHEKITQDEWENCIRRFNKSLLDGNLYQVSKWNKNVEKLNVKEPIPPKMEEVKEDFNPIGLIKEMFKKN